jgi:hypothetical protein
MESTRSKLIKLGLVCVICVGLVTGLALLINALS